jgi:NADH-quinone oxidoreductase subunit I
MIKALGYFLEIIKGGLITARHFVVNMWFHTLKVMGLKTKRRGAVTIQYPEEKKELAARHRSLHRLTKREDGKPRCVSCFLCVTVCSSECISVEASEEPDSEMQKAPANYVIDMSRCCFCGFCVEACPVDAIRMDTGRIEVAEYRRQDLTYDIPRLLK